MLTPIVPCRAVDTRLGGSHLARVATRSFLIEGSGDFTSQGGPAFGCGIPTGATALAAVITSVNPAAIGYLTAYPTGTAGPLTSILNYSRATTSSGVTVTITPNVSRGLTVFDFGGRTNLTVDITGYHSRRSRPTFWPKQPFSRTAAGCCRRSVRRPGLTE